MKVALSLLNLHQEKKDRFLIQNTEDLSRSQSYYRLCHKPPVILLKIRCLDRRRS